MAVGPAAAAAATLHARALSGSIAAWLLAEAAVLCNGEWGAMERVRGTAGACGRHLEGSPRGHSFAAPAAGAPQRSLCNPPPPLPTMSMLDSIRKLFAKEDAEAQQRRGGSPAAAYSALSSQPPQHSPNAPPAAHPPSHGAASHQVSHSAQHSQHAESDRSRERPRRDPTPVPLRSAAHLSSHKLKSNERAQWKSSLQLTR